MPTTPSTTQPDHALSVEDDGIDRLAFFNRFANSGQCLQLIIAAKGLVLNDPYSSQLLSSSDPRQMTFFLTYILTVQLTSIWHSI